MTPEPALVGRAFQEQIDDLVRRLDPRERAILLAIYEHKVLLTEHVKAMFFTSLRRAQDRLHHLMSLGLIETWYPPQPRGTGKAPGHHTLTESGAQVVTSLLDVARSELRWVGRDIEARENDAYLAHRIGVNAFFCALIEAGREHDGHGLYKWVPERTVRTAGGWIRPDSYGAYLHPKGACDFYFEYDRGTETTRQLANKLAGYIGVAREWTGQGTEHFPNLLILVPKLTRERTVSLALADALARFKNSEMLGVLPFFVASEAAVAAGGVLGGVWTPIQKLDGRLSIIELPTSKGVSYELSDCIGRRFTEDQPERWARLMPLSRRPHFPVGEPPGDEEEPPDEGVVA